LQPEKPVADILPAEKFIYPEILQIIRQPVVFESNSCYFVEN